MTEREKEIIKDNLRSFVANFGEVRIETNGLKGTDKAFMVYSPADRDTYVQYCYSIEYLDGWLYGCVQGAMGQVQFSKERKAELEGR